jgi:hypothetical protein
MMARLLRHARKRPVDEAHDDELRHDATVAATPAAPREA